MPELPEVETVRRQLTPFIICRPIRDVAICDPRLGAYPDVVGEVVKNVTRIGKTLAICLDSGRTLLLQLRMTGRLFWQDGYYLPSRYRRFYLSFDTGTLELIDPRRFATLILTAEEVREEPAFPKREDISHIIAQALRRRVPVKVFLLDQRVFPGIGNIYACEILHAARIPTRKSVNTLKEGEWEHLLEVAQSILDDAIRRRGTTISDWRDLFGNPGENQFFLQVYGREGEPCHTCGRAIVRERIGARGTYFCECCQA